MKTPECFFLDTCYLAAIINPNDGLRDRALLWQPRVNKASTVVVTEAILDELGALLAGAGPKMRRLTATFIDACYATSNITVVEVNTALFKRGVALYASRLDKAWSLTDCISFLVMEDEGISEAITYDKHFVQAGKRALLRPDPNG